MSDTVNLDQWQWERLMEAFSRQHSLLEEIAKAVTAKPGAPKTGSIKWLDEPATLTPGTPEMADDLEQFLGRIRPTELALVDDLVKLVGEEPSNPNAICMASNLPCGDLAEALAENAELRAELDRLAERVRELELEAMVDAPTTAAWEAMQSRLSQIDAAAAKLPEMPKLVWRYSGQFYGLKQPDLKNYATIMRDTAASLQVRNAELEDERDALQVWVEELEVPDYAELNRLLLDNGGVLGDSRCDAVRRIVSERDDLRERVNRLDSTVIGHRDNIDAMRRERDTAIQALRDGAQLRGLAESQRDVAIAEAEGWKKSFSNANAMVEMMRRVSGCEDTVQLGDHLQSMRIRISDYWKRIQEAEAEAEGLRRELENECRDNQRLVNECPKCASVAAAHRQGAEEERGKLAPYTSHRTGCPALIVYTKDGSLCAMADDPKSECTCGLREALAPTENKEKNRA